MRKILWILFFCFGASLVAQPIYPVSRESGSGTRGAFVEIFEVYKTIKNKKIDATTKKAEVTNSTGVMLTTVANSKNSIGYLSLGSLNAKVKALKIDGVAPSVENIKNKQYSIARPFNIAFKKESPLLSDFLAYVKSKEAQKVIEKSGYIAVSNEDFVSQKIKGKLVVAGSSSVSPLMEKLIEGYAELNPNATIELQQSDSTTGINSVVENIADLGMASREVKSSELQKGIHIQTLAIDGLAVIVSLQNSIDSLSKDQVKNIFLGEITSWDNLK